MDVDERCRNPFWIFFSISFGFLAFLLGVFEKQPLNLVFAALFYFAAGATAILIYWMGDPYHGPSRIASTPLTQLVAKMQSLDETQ
jgi:apolipoprotein N-acyltransferase